MYFSHSPTHGPLFPVSKRSSQPVQSSLSCIVRGLDWGFGSQIVQRGLSAWSPSAYPYNVFAQRITIHHISDRFDFISDFYICTLPPGSHYLVIWKSSTLSNNATVSVASSTALVDTNRGCTTSSSKIFEINPYATTICQSVSRETCYIYLLTVRTLIPAFFSPSACRFRSSVTIAIGFNPAFSASVVGITSSASAYACKQ